MQARLALITPGSVDPNEGHQRPDPPLARSARRRVLRTHAGAIRTPAVFLQGRHKSPLFGRTIHSRASIARATHRAPSAPPLFFLTSHKHGQATLSAEQFHRKELSPFETQRSIPQTSTFDHKPAPTSNT